MTNKKILIIRKDNVVFTEFIDKSEPYFLHSLDDSLNSFKEDLKFLKIKDCLVNNDDEIEVSELKNHQSTNEFISQTNNQKSISNRLMKNSSSSDKKKDEIKFHRSNYDSQRESYLKSLRTNNLILEKLLDELESLKRKRIRTGEF